MAGHLQFDAQDKAALRALNSDFIITPMESLPLMPLERSLLFAS